MIISSRTPEGQPNQCSVCLNDFIIEPSVPPGDATCPHCGSLAWFPVGSIVTCDLRPLSSIPPDPMVSVRDHRPEYQLSKSELLIGRLLRPLVAQWSRQRRKRVRRRLAELLKAIAECQTRQGLDVILGKPRCATKSGQMNTEYYIAEDCDIRLQFVRGRLESMRGVAQFSSMEWGAGIPPDQDWICAEGVGGKIN